jgi:hypothetical protein
VEFRGSLAYKVFASFQENKSQELKETALELSDQHVIVTIGDQQHIKVITVKEQLQELQGRQNQMISERSFFKAVANRYEKLLKHKKITRKYKKRV